MAGHLTGSPGHVLDRAPKDLFGGKAAEAVLLALFHQGEAYGRTVARDFAFRWMPSSATRDLQHLAGIGALVPLGGGRSTRYELTLE